MMQEERSTPPSSLEDGFVNEGFCPEEPPKSSGTSNGKFNNEIVVPKSFSDDLDGSQDEQCGWLFLKPKLLQRFRTAKWVLFWLCCAGTIQGMVINGFVNVCITTIEKRFNLKSSNSGLIAGFYDIGCVLCTIPVSYLGSRPGASKPKWLGWGMLIMGCGSFVFSLPHFISPVYDLGTFGHDSTSSVLLCLKQNNKTEACKNEAHEWLSNFKHIFFLGQFLHGMGAVPLYTLGTTFLDESVPVKMSALYLGIFHAMAVIGPAVGYVLGGRFLSIYIDSPSVDPATFGISMDSEQWLGAWWIGFLLAGSFAVILSFIGLSFPAEIPGSKERTIERINASAEQHTSAPFGRLRDLPQAALSLVKNLPYIFLSLAETSEGLLLAGFATFMPKVIESQFSVSAGYAALLVGIIAVPAGGGGTLVGGWLVKRFQLGCSGISKYCGFIAFVTAFVSIGFTLSCPNSLFAGVNTEYSYGLTVSKSPSLDASCNSDCQCDEHKFDPVCGANKVLYFSPCHAGCRDSHSWEGHQLFSSCKCILNSTSYVNETLSINSPSMELLSLETGSAARQKCPSTCAHMPYFLILFFILMLATFLISMPSVSGTLRCVPDSHRSLALGLQAIMGRLLGTIPGPILFGYIIDSTCVLWQPTCDGTGACRNYDNFRMSRSLLAVTLTFKFLSSIFYFLAWLTFRIRKSSLDKSKAADLTIQNNYAIQNHNIAFENT